MQQTAYEFEEGPISVRFPKRNVFGIEALNRLGCALRREKPPPDFFKHTPKKLLARGDAREFLDKEARPPTGSALSAGVQTRAECTAGDWQEAGNWQGANSSQSVE